MYNIESLFLGPKAGNAKVFEELLLEIFRDHVFWRRHLHPHDPFGVTPNDQQDEAFTRTVVQMRNEIYNLLGKLKDSQPFHSPRYLGHMNSDTLIPAVLGYFAAMLYNPNNVAYEGSPATTELELQVGRELAALMGFDPNESWGHITSGGTVANFEGLWVARNLKQFPLCARQVARKLNLEVNVTLANGQTMALNEADDKLLIRSVMPVEALSLKARLVDQYLAKKGVSETNRKHVEDMLSKTGLGQKGLQAVKQPLGKVLVPQSKHYSWKKAVEILGLGRDSLAFIPVDEKYRIDAGALKEQIEVMAETGTPILAVVGVIGSTEESSVDPIDRIVALRKEAGLKHNLGFYFHLDAAYGGYARSVFFNAQGVFMKFDELQETLRKRGIMLSNNWPAKEVYNAFEAMEEADSITVDPHKLGYIPYSAGAVVFRDDRIKDMVACFAPYVFRAQSRESSPQLVGMYIMEGSKPGAAAAACWMAHRVVPLNITGYGKIIGESIEGAYSLYEMLDSLKEIEVTRGKKTVVFQVAPLTLPDLNIVCYAFNIKGNTSLAKMNSLNKIIKDRKFSFDKGVPLAAKQFIISSTDLSRSEYGDIPARFVEKLGITPASWKKEKSVFILRSCVLTPYLTTEYIAKDYVCAFEEAIRKALEELVQEGALPA